MTAASSAKERKAAAADGQRPMRRAVSEEDKASRRQDILAAAKRVFADRGYHATTIADIAREAGLSYGSIYWYYESKETLFHELMSAEAASLREHINEAVAAALRPAGSSGSVAAAGPAGSSGSVAAAGPAASLRAAVHATVEFYDSDRALVKLLFRDAFALGESFEEHLSKIHGSFVSDTERLVISLQRQGVFGPGPSRVIAVAITSLIGQLAHRRLVTHDGLTADQLSDFIVGLVLNGLLVQR